MIRYDLICDNAHEFEGWFGSADDFDGQTKRALVNCPTCGSPRVTKRLMAPSVSTARKKEEQRHAVMNAHNQEMMGKLRELVDRDQGECRGCRRALSRRGAQDPLRRGRAARPDRQGDRRGGPRADRGGRRDRAAAGPARRQELNGRDGGPSSRDVQFRPARRRLRQSRRRGLPPARGGQLRGGEPCRRLRRALRLPGRRGAGKLGRAGLSAVHRTGSGFDSAPSSLSLWRDIESLDGLFLQRCACRRAQARAQLEPQAELAAAGSVVGRRRAAGRTGGTASPGWNGFTIMVPAQGPSPSKNPSPPRGKLRRSIGRGCGRSPKPTGADRSSLLAHVLSLKA